MPLLNSFHYLLKTRMSRSQRTRLAPIFLLSFAGALLVFALSWTIKGMDLVLHNDINPTVSWSTYPAMNFTANAAIAEGCSDPRKPLCPVKPRASEARLGALNQSDVFRVYPHQGPANSSVGSLAFIGPPRLPGNLTITNAHTYAAGTTCKAYHPECFVADDTIEYCYPNTGELDDQPIYDFILQRGFTTTSMRYRMQTFLLSKGDAVVLPPDKMSLSNGANVNPLNFATWGCFSDYANIQHDDKNTPPFKTPFINWWMYGQGIPNDPILCSISVCNTTLYDASYSTKDGKFTLDVNHMHMANKSATLALSGGAVFLGTGDSDLYQYTKSYMDELLQVDLSAAGNVHGNDTEAFVAAWGMGISNRLLGWSAKAIELRPPADTNSVQNRIGTLALSIELPSAYAFTITHFVYAGLILLLGVSCAFIPANLVPDAPSQEYADGKRPPTDVAATQAKLSDFSTLLLEVLDAREVGKRRPLRSRSTTSLSLSDADEQSVERRVRLGLRRKSDGALGLDFHDE
jgi:hypothetical protein